MKNTNLIIGKINTGKTTGIMFNELEKLINNKESLVILDNREEYYKTYKNELESNNYTTLVFNLKYTEKSNSYNPLMLPYKYYKSGKKDIAMELLHTLSLEIFKSDNPTSDPFWENSAANYFISLVLILFKEAKEEEINLASLLIMLNESEKKVDNERIIDKYFSTLSILDNIYIAGSSIVYAPADTRGSIIAVMKQSLNSYCMREELLNNLSGNEIDLTNLPNKVAIFIIGNESLNRLANILIDQLIDCNKQITFILDNICDMPKLLRLNKMLDQKIKSYVIVRDEAILKDKYGKFITTKFENIMKDNKVTNCKEIGNCDEYPLSKSNNPSYFNFLELVKNK